MSHPELPDQFVDSRKGPWPQTSPSHPLICADEVLHLSLEDEFAFDKTIGLRYAESLITYQWAAAEYVRKNQDWTGVDDARFNAIMFTTIYTKFLKPLSPSDVERCKKIIFRLTPTPGNMILRVWICLSRSRELTVPRPF